MCSCLSTPDQKQVYFIKFSVPRLFLFVSRSLKISMFCVDISFSIFCDALYIPVDNYHSRKSSSSIHVPFPRLDTEFLSTSHFTKNLLSASRSNPQLSPRCTAFITARNPSTPEYFWTGIGIKGVGEWLEQAGARPCDRDVNYLVHS